MALQIKRTAPMIQDAMRNLRSTRKIRYKKKRSDSLASVIPITYRKVLKTLVCLVVSHLRPFQKGGGSCFGRAYTKPTLVILRWQIIAMSPTAVMKPVNILQSGHGYEEPVGHQDCICINQDQQACQSNSLAVAFKHTILPSRGLCDPELGIASRENDQRQKPQAYRVGNGGHPCCRWRTVVVIVRMVSHIV